MRCKSAPMGRSRWRWSIRRESTTSLTWYDFHDSAVLARICRNGAPLESGKARVLKHSII
ncbi:S-adenosyl-L-methionine-dependent methyltransferase superfamily protein [Zea mays]|uniref:S-adenosyl-L-methionine-dependent methyltransferase superfamily protein n=1 Tax=Zea mays TaxID=4577 RepID=A0A1D6LAB1_MAIZE|nr:S-adenosyl-L-methionine-dependent methyltransferase superfamily protein [Zea mays]